MNNNVQIQSVLNINILTVKRIFLQTIFILYDYLSENYVSYSLMHLKKLEHKFSLQGFILFYKSNTVKSV